MSDLALLACPFCGGVAAIMIERTEKYKILPNYNYIPACVNCGVNLYPQNTQKEAIESWNTRASG